MAEVELRTRTLLADEEAAANRDQQRLREEEIELEVQKRTQSERAEHLRVHTKIRERSRDSETGRAYATMHDRVQQQMMEFQRQAQEERDRMARERQERGALYLADPMRRQQAIDQLTEALSATLSRLPTASPAAASGSAPPPPPCGGNAPGTEWGEFSGRPMTEVTLPAASSHATSSRPTKTGPPGPPPGGDDGSDDGSSSEESSDEEGDFEEVGDEDSGYHDDRAARKPRPRVTSGAGHQPGSRRSPHGDVA
jgi:hypothetical protein